MADVSSEGKGGFKQPTEASPSTNIRPDVGQNPNTQQGAYGQFEHTPFDAGYDHTPFTSVNSAGVSGSTITLPFQPRVYQDGNDFYFEFTSTGVIFLPVGKVNGGHNDWHIPWNEAWPFRPTMVDSSGGSARAINDSDAFGGSTVRRPRLLLSSGNQNIIYVEITFVQNENSIADHKDATGAYSGVKTLLPNYKIVGTTDSVTPSGDSNHSHPVDLETYAMKDNIGAPFGAGTNSGLTPHAYVPIAERNYAVEAAPEVKVLSAPDGDGDNVFLVKNDSWRSVELTRKFVWGSITFDDTTDPATPLIEWWRFDCPTYMINNHTVDDTSDGTRDIPLPHEADDDPTASIPNAPNTGLSATI